MAQEAGSDNTAAGRGSSRKGEYGPLGPGHAPEKDPLKGLRGVMAGTMCMELITFLLAFPVVMRVDGGSYASAFNITYVSVLCVAMLVMMFLQKQRWAIPVDVAVQVLAVIGFFVHPALGIMGLIYAAVWAYIPYLRHDLLERMKRGYLASQHT